MRYPLYKLSEEQTKTLRSLDLFKNVIFEFRAGWFDLIYNLGKEITDYCNSQNIPLPKVQQIKEKFGTLRFYYMDKTKDDYIRELVIKAEEKSESICEVCGKPGITLVQDGLFYTACDKHKRPNSITLSEYKKQMEELQRQRTKCDVCGAPGADHFYNFLTKGFENRCPNCVDSNLIPYSEWAKSQI